MKNLKKVSIVTSMVAIIGIGSFAYASDFLTPQDITSDLTGKTSEEVRIERESGKTYGEIAKEEGKLEEFKSSMLENKKAILDEKASQNQMTKEERDTIISRIEENMKSCDGEGGKGIARELGAGFGQGQGRGKGQGQGLGQRQGKNAL